LAHTTLAPTRHTQICRATLPSMLLGEYELSNCLIDLLMLTIIYEFLTHVH